MTAATHKAGDIGMISSAVAESTAPASKYGLRRPSHVQVRSEQIADQRLNQNPVRGRGNPQRGNVDRDLAPSVSKDAADIGVLQAQSELQAQKSETHIPDLPEGYARLDTERRFGRGTLLQAHNARAASTAGQK